MARIRTIKPDFFKDETVSDLSPEARLLYISLWLQADREGRLEDRPRFIKAETFPYHDLDVAPLLKDLANQGLIVRYVAQSRPYIQIKNFLKHQRPNERESKSVIPAPSEHDTTPVSTCTQDSVDVEGEGEKEGNGNMEGKGNSNSLVELARPVGVLSQITEVFDYWKEQLGHPKARLDVKRSKAIEARLKEGYSVDRIKQAVRGIKLFPHNMGENDRNTKYDDIELICRSGMQVDKYADKEDEPTDENAWRRKNPTLRALDQWKKKFGRVGNEVIEDDRFNGFDKKVYTGF